MFSERDSVPSYKSCMLMYNYAYTQYMLLNTFLIILFSASFARSCVPIQYVYIMHKKRKKVQQLVGGCVFSVQLLGCLIYSFNHMIR